MAMDRTQYGVSGPRRAPLPSLRFGMEWSAGFDEITSQTRFHNRAGRTTLATLLAEHHKQRIPRHFQRPSRSEYGYQPRSPKYVAIKKARGRGETDLVKMGRLERSITGMYRGPVFSGQFTAVTGMAGTITMKIPWPATRDPSKPGAVTIEQMKREIRMVTPQEGLAAAQRFKHLYGDELRAALAAGRSRRVKVV